MRRNVASSKVFPCERSPVRKPCVNQAIRCAEEPWVKESGTTFPWPWRCSVSSPIAFAACSASSMSPSSRIPFVRWAWWAQTPAKKSAWS